MSVDALEELAGWPDNENTFLVSGPDGVRLAVAPADVGGELGMMAALDWAYARYGAAFADSAEPVWRLRRWHGCRATGFADWIGDAEKCRPARRPRPCRRRGPIGGDMADCHVRGKPIGDRKPWLV